MRRRLSLSRTWRRWTWLLLALLLGLLSIRELPAPAASGEAPVLSVAQRSSTAEPTVATCRMGVFIEDLRDFNFSEKSLYASLRLWSVCPTGEIKPLEDLEITNANEISLSEVKTRLEPNLSRAFPGTRGLYWSELGVSGSFYYPWSAQNFPFDRHRITFEIIPRGLDQGQFLISPDFQSSGFNPRIGSGDWLAFHFRINESAIDLGSSFGNPAIPAGRGSEISSIKATLELRRARITSFLKMCVGVYAAVVISAMAFYVDPREPDLVSGRTGLCVGCLFAAIVNMQQAESTLGASEDVTLMDQIHIVAIIFILMSTVLAIVSYLRCERDQADRAQRLDRRLHLPIFSASFLVVNAVIISYAVLVG
ncbi:MAG: hypothetical protein ACKOXO_10470 [Cyanobium sp.]